MDVILPTWNDLTPWVHHLVDRAMAATALPPSAIAVFEDTEPTLLIRPGRRGGSPQGECEALGIVALLDVRRVVVVQPMRLRDPDADGIESDLTATSAVLVTRGDRTDEDVCVEAVFHELAVGDHGAVEVHGPLPVPEPSPMAANVAHALQVEPVPSADRAGIAYAAERFGHGVAVASRWRSHYGFDQPLAPHMVRHEDRARVAHARAAA